MSSFEKTTHIIGADDVNNILQRLGPDAFMDELIRDLDHTLHEFDPENINIPARSGFHYKFPFTGLIEWMPLYSRGDQITIKLVGYHPHNPDIFDVPTILSSIYRFDTNSGHLNAIMDGVLPTALRTGAISAVATRLMAKRGDGVVGMIGCGAQSITQIHALSRVMDITEILYYDIDKNASDSLRHRLSPLGLECEMRPSPIKEILKSSDVICTATSIDIGQGPLFKDTETKPHLHINAVGSDFPGKVEIPQKLLRRSVVIPDFRDQAVIEGECQQLTSAEIGPEISALVKTPDHYTYIKDRTSIFDSTGWALEDHVIMELVVKYAQQFGLGQHLKLEYFPNDTKNPYEFLNKKVDSENDKTKKQLT